ncbi:MAG TPA: porin [Vicinamibacterales bacterium]|nr:porin [Vicinamibacterales bacterium]
MIRTARSGIGPWSPTPHRTRRSLFALIALTASLVVTTPAAAQPPATPPQRDGVRWEGTSLHLGDSVRLDPRVRVQADILVHDQSDAIEDRFAWGSRRIGLNGELFNRVQFQIERAFQDDDDDDTAWRDVYADVRITRALQIRGGRFKLPFSMERNTSREELDFIQRATVVRALAPARDTGVMVHGRVAGRLLEYEVGVFQHADGFESLDNANSWGPLGETLAGRVILTPIEDRDDSVTRDLQFGVAVVKNTIPEGLHGVVGRTFAGDRFFDRMHVHGNRTRLGAEALWTARRLTLKGELLQLTDQRAQQAITGDDLSDLVLRGGYITAVVRVAGERGRRGPAVDVAARIDRLSLGSRNDTDDAFTNPRADNVAPLHKDTWTFGASWLVNRWVRVQGNAIRERLVDPLGVRDVSPAGTWVSLVRLQFAL